MYADVILYISTVIFYIIRRQEIQRGQFEGQTGRSGGCNSEGMRGRGAEMGVERRGVGEEEQEGRKRRRNIEGGASQPCMYPLDIR